MQAHAVGARQQFIHTGIVRLVLLLDLRRQTRPLRVDDAHAERQRAQRQLPADLPQTHDAKLLAVKRHHVRDARPVAVRRVRTVVGRRLVAGFFQLLDADEVGILGELAGEREHQGQSLLGSGDIGAAANRQDLDARRVTSGAVDVARGETIFLHKLQTIAGCGNFFLADC